MACLNCCEHHGHFLASHGTDRCPECHSAKKPQRLGPMSRIVKTAKTVEYTCGCIFEVCGIGKKEAPRVCGKHLKPPAKITTVETFSEATLSTTYEKKA